MIEFKPSDLRGGDEFTCDRGMTWYRALGQAGCGGGYCIIDVVCLTPPADPTVRVELELRVNDKVIVRFTTK